MSSGWHTGSNLPGFLPDSDIHHYEGWIDAYYDMQDKIDEHVDHLYGDEDRDESELEQMSQEVTEELKQAIKREEQEVTIEFGYEYWVKECTEKECVYESRRTTSQVQNQALPQEATG